CCELPLSCISQVWPPGSEAHGCFHYQFIRGWSCWGTKRAGPELLSSTTPWPISTTARPAFLCSPQPVHPSPPQHGLLSSALLSRSTQLHSLNMLGLNWQLKPADGHLINNGLSTEVPGRSDVATAPSGGRGPWVYRNSSISTGELEVGRRMSQDVPPGVFWRSLLHLRQPLFLKFNISLGKDALFGVYIRKGLPPSHAQYDYMERLDGKEKWSVVESPRERRSIHTVVLNEAIFVQYLDPGTWHLAFYNDGKDKESVSFSTMALDSVQECPQNCHGNGECMSGVCHCFPGFHGMDCAKAACPVLCSGNGQYDKGLCICYSGWKGPECDVSVGQCIDPECNGHGTCSEGSCTCSAGYRGDTCEEVDCLDPGCSGHGTCAKVCSSDCGAHGVCIGGVCRCEEGWTGAGCDQRVCNPLCVKHGTCRDGKCQCQQGWNGEHCTIGMHPAIQPVSQPANTLAC
ncbi:unnamed protein product, partial [Coregonus sp. 'balchen']